MRIFLVFVLLSSSVNFTFGHSYYFAFAEIEFNSFTQKMECTLSASKHDIDIAIVKDSVCTQAIEHIQPDSKNYLLLESYLNEHFQVRCNSINTHFNLKGIEVLLNGNINFYMESDEFVLSSPIEIKYDILFDHFNQQQNKVNFIYNNTSQVLEFIGESSYKSINLETIKHNE